MGDHGQGWRDQEEECRKKIEQEDMTEWIRTTQGIVNAVVISLFLWGLIYIVINGWPR